MGVSRVLVLPTGQPSPSQEVDSLVPKLLLILSEMRPWGNKVSKAWRNPFPAPVASGSFKIAKQNLLHCWWECKLVQPLRKTARRFLKKLKIELPYDPAIPLLGIYPEKNMVQKDTCTPNVHCSTTYNSQDMEAT